MNNGTLLEVKGITKRFGGLTAVDNVDYVVGPREIRGIIGPNGAGKTTFFNLITGEIKPTSGKVLLEGKDITGLPPHVICRRGMSRTFQLTFIFPDMTVFDCVWVGVYSRMRGSWNLLFSRVDRRGEIAEKAVEICRLVGLEERMEERASNLSYGDQKVLEIAMALSTDPKILLLDEPTAGMAPDERIKMMHLLKELHEYFQLTTIFIEHDMDMVFGIAQIIRVLVQGQLIAEGTADYIRQHEAVIESYLGKEVL